MGDKPARKSKRISMKGMGADAFFNPPAEVKEEEISVSQDTNIPEGQYNDKTVSQESILPAHQQDSTLTEQSTAIPASQQAIVPIKQESTMPVTPYTDIPVSQHTSTPDKQDFIKATYYIRPEQDIKLEQIRLQRRLKGEKVDKSALVREMIDRFSKEEDI